MLTYMSHQFFYEQTSSIDTLNYTHSMTELLVAIAQIHNFDFLPQNILKLSLLFKNNFNWIIKLSHHNLKITSVAYSETNKIWKL